MLDLDDDVIHEGEPFIYILEKKMNCIVHTGNTGGEMEFSDGGLGQGSNQTGKTK